jgi:protein TonB
MHFSDIKDGSGSKFTKIAIVAALHVAVGAALVANMNSKVFTMPRVDELVTVFVPEEMKKEPPPPPEAKTKPVEQTRAPEIVAPPVEVPIQEPMESPVVAVVQADPVPAQPGPVVVDAPPATPSTNAGAMRTAVFADANACAKPDYPTNAARNGETGTVTLALLVGTDGKVAGSKIQRSSGHRDLDKAAVNALSMCKFKPAMNGGVPEQAWAQLSYVWTLEG